jgi:hypothetical protein
VRPDLYDPQINLAYGELASFYGTLIDPARANKLKDKPRIERPMPYIRGCARCQARVRPIPRPSGVYTGGDRNER